MDGNWIFRCPPVAQLVQHASAGHRAWQYEFARVMPGERWAGYFAEGRYGFGTPRRAEARSQASQPDEIDDPDARAYLRVTDAGPVSGEGLCRAACDLWVEMLRGKGGGW